MNTSAQNYADRLIAAICECLARCQAADDAVECAQEFVSQLQADPTWQRCDTERIERAVMRTVRPIEALDLKLRA